MTGPIPMPYPNADAPAQDLIAACVHCGFCLPTCPTFAVLGVEMDSPRGRIHLMKTVWDHRLGADSPGLEDHISKCLDCRACETACPSGVEYGKLVEGARSQIVTARPRSGLERLVRVGAFDWLLPHRRILGAFAVFSIEAKRLGMGTLLRATRLGLARRMADLLDTIFQCQQRQEWFRNYARSMGEKPLAFVGSARLLDGVVPTAARIRTSPCSSWPTPRAWWWTSPPRT